MSVNCNLEQQSTEKPLTVGQEFFVLCEGDLPDVKDTQAIELRLEKEDHYKLKLLSLEPVNSKQWSLKMVSYQVGSHDIKAVQVIASDESIVLGDLRFTVSSVMKPEEPIQEPFGVTAPVKAAWPLELLILASLFVFTLAALVIWRIVKKAQRRTWLKSNRALYATSSREKETYSRLRNLRRKLEVPNEFLKELETLTLLQFSWWCDLPAPQLGLKKTIKQLKNLNLSEETLSSSRTLLKELERWQKAKSSPSANQAEVLFQMLSQLVDQFVDLQKGSSK